MSTAVRAVIRQGRVEPVEPLSFPEGSEVVVSLRQVDDERFWQDVAGVSLNAIWDNAEDDVYAELLEK